MQVYVQRNAPIHTVCILVHSPTSVEREGHAQYSFPKRCDRLEKLRDSFGTCDAELRPTLCVIGIVTCEHSCSFLGAVTFDLAPVTLRVARVRYVLDLLLLRMYAS